MARSPPAVVIWGLPELLIVGVAVPGTAGKNVQGDNKVHGFQDRNDGKVLGHQGDDTTQSWTDIRAATLILRLGIEALEGVERRREGRDLEAARDRPHPRGTRLCQTPGQSTSSASLFES